MDVIFKKSSSCALLVYIHCTTAAQQDKLESKLFRHSEYTSKWDDMCDKWIEKKYFTDVVREKLLGVNSVITVLTFIDGRNDDFIKELSLYLEDDFEPYGYSEVKYVSYDKM